MKRMLVVLGGRVNGNTSKVVDAFIRDVSEAGHDKMRYYDKERIVK